MEVQNPFTIEEIKEALTEMKIPFEEKESESHKVALARMFQYEPLPLVVDLKAINTIDAEDGIVVRHEDKQVDNGVYVFTVLHTGQAGFLVVIPGTLSRAPMVRKVTGDMIAAISGIDLPPMLPFDMIEVVAHTLANTFLKDIMDTYKIPEDYRPLFLKSYMPRFLANVGLYFNGVTNKDGSPAIHENTANIEPMILWRSIEKKEGLNHESDDDVS